MKRIAVIIPAYNEEASISGVVSSLLALRSSHGLHIDPVVVNDCSRDRTAEVCAKLECILLNLPVNLGIGSAVQTGFRYARRHDYDFAIQVDGDGQHPATEIPKLLEALQSDEADVVIGSRFLLREGYQSEFYRRIGIRYFMVVNRLITGQAVTDNTSGFRAYNRRALAVVSSYYPDQYPEPEAVVLFKRNGLRLKEVPVTMRERQGGQSSISRLASLFYMAKVSFAIVFASLRQPTVRN